MSVVCQINCVGGITYGPHACSKSFFLAVKPVTPGLSLVIHFLYAIASAWTKKKLKLAPYGNHFSSVATASVHSEKTRMKKLMMMKMIIIGRAKRAPHWGVQSRFRVIYIYMCVCRMSNHVESRESNTRMLKVSIGR